MKDAPYSLAMVADWLPTFGGAEHVIWQWCTMWPNAPLFTTLANTKHIGPIAEHKHIRTSYLQTPYTLLKNHQILLPFMPRAIESFNTTGYDVILSSSHAVGKGIIPPSDAVHVCYCHTPMRYAWEMEDQYLHDFNVPKLLQPLVKRQLAKLREWDLTTAKRTDYFIANSSETAARIKRIYNRESAVLNPPVSDEFCTTDVLPTDQREDYYLALGRLVPYKRYDLLIEAANQSGMQLVIAGTGQDETRLKAMAGPTVRFLGKVPQDELAELYRTSKALLFPQLEDAGVVPLEAQACGTPVIAYGKGGALDTVQHKETGVHFAEQTVSSLLSAIKQFEALRFDAKTIQNHAKQFSDTNYKAKLLEHIDTAREQFFKIS